MTNERACANRPSMTRGQMQTEALIIENLLSTAMAMADGDNMEHLLRMVEMAHDRAAQLNGALDIVHAVEMPA